MNRLAVTFFCAGVSTWQFITLSLATCTDCLTTIAELNAGNLPGPFVYRVLTPQILVWLGNTVPSTVAFHFLMLLAFFWLLWSWVEHWGGQGATAVALATVALTVMYPTYYFSFYTVTEWALWLAGLMLLLRPATRQMMIVYGVLVVVGMANREMTAVLLLTSWFALKPRHWRAGGLYVVLAAAAYVAIQLAVGPHPNSYTLATVLEYNLRDWTLRNLIVYGSLLLVLFMAGVANRTHSMRELRRLTWGTMLVYLPLWATMAVWQETRLLMPVLILWLPLITRTKSAAVVVVDNGAQSLASGHTAAPPTPGAQRLEA